MNAADIVMESLRRVQFGRMTTFRNMSVLPLSTAGGGDAEYLTLDEALARKSVQIVEVSENGRVPELKIVNDDERPVLLLDGEELVGAKQNRVLNLTILAPAKQTRVIPVSCVESGRWHHTSSDFASSPHAHFAQGRAAKMQHVTSSLKASGRHSSDQGDVWSQIAAKSARLDASSDTSAMSAIFDRHHVSLEEFVAAFTPTERQAGAMFFVGAWPAGLELFNTARTWRTLSPKLIRSYALDALDQSRDTVQSNDPWSPSAFIDRLMASQPSVFPAVGDGEDVRFDGNEIAGAALVVSGELIHMSAFPKTSTRKGGRPSA